MSRAFVLGSAVDTAGPAFAANETANRALAQELRDRITIAALGGPEKTRERHVARGKLLPRDRVDLLLDPGSPFLEIAPLAAHGLYGKDGHAAPGAGMIAGVGRVAGRAVLVLANHATVNAGSSYPMGGPKPRRAQAAAPPARTPSICPGDCGGGFRRRRAWACPAREHSGRIFYSRAALSQTGVPQIAAVRGSCTAGGACVPA